MAILTKKLKTNLESDIYARLFQQKTTVCGKHYDFWTVHVLWGQTLLH